MKARILKSGIHRGEEPLVWGNDRAGMVVFSGCHLTCSFCYTPETSVYKLGTDVDADGFTQVLATLLAGGARNINLISPSHVWSAIEPVLQRFKSGEGRPIPLVLKFSGFESPSLIRRFAAVADVLVPDFKVWSGDLAASFTLPPQYGPVAARAIQEMMRTHSETVWEGGKMKHGMVVRHLLMPGCQDDSRAVVDKLGQLGFNGHLNFMTHFISPEKGLMKAEPERVNELARRAARLGMNVLVDAQLLAGKLHSNRLGRAS